MVLFGAGSVGGECVVDARVKTRAERELAWWRGPKGCAL